MLQYQQLHETKGLTSSQQATLQVPAGGKIQSLLLDFDGTEAQIRAEIGNIRLAVNGRDVINASATQLLDMYEALGVKVGDAAGIDGCLELNVGRLVYNNPALRDLVGYGTADVANIQVQVTAGTLSGISQVQAISFRTAAVENFGAHCEFISYPQSFNSTGDHTVDTLPRDLNSSYLALMINDGASGTITHNEIRVNGNTIRERLPSDANAWNNSNLGYDTPAGYFPAFLTDGTIDTRLPMDRVTDFRSITTFSVAPGAGGYSIGALTLVLPSVSN
jgi:hypothetical protein